MKLRILSVLILFLSIQVFSWGPTGHRVVGKVAEQYLSKKAKKKIAAILNNESLAEVSNWMDDIKSERLYDYARDWHWVTIPTGKTYEEAKKNPNGDVVTTIQRLIAELKTGGLTQTKEAEYIKMLVHLIGDIHQPLHVGNGKDRGGNDVQVDWFREKSNLHRVWDSHMIDSKQYSYTELAEIVTNVSKEQVTLWQEATVLDWAYESMAYRDKIYGLPANKRIGYRYMYDHWSTVELRLVQAGARLAAVLNDIYG
ncbi:MAG: S1/P1 nuclease [Bacteroidota bacterium]